MEPTTFEHTRTVSARDRRRRRRTDVSQNHDRWVVSYADFVTLLFACFAMMYAISLVDAERLGAVVTALQVAFDVKKVDLVVSDLSGQVPPIAGRPLSAGILPGSESSGQPSQSILANHGEGLLETTLEDVRARLAARLGREVANGQVSLEIDHRGLVISISEAGTFSTGQSDLSPPVQALVAEIAEPLKGIGNAIRIEGHTDDVPIKTSRFASNWELSTARATAVVAFLIQKVGLDSTRMSAAGYSEYHPRVPNDTLAHRSQNRRVDIVVLNPQTSRAEEPE